MWKSHCCPWATDLLWQENSKMNKEDFIQLQQTAKVGDWGQFEKAWEALINDLNTPACLGNIFSTLNNIDAPKLTENGETNRKVSDPVYDSVIKLGFCGTVTGSKRLSV